MRIIVTKLTDEKIMRRACEMTMHGKKSKASLAAMYRCEHSPMRTQMFWVEMHEIPQFVSVHFVRHNVGVEHFVSSLRDDLWGQGTEDRWSPVMHGMCLN